MCDVFLVMARAPSARTPRRRVSAASAAAIVLVAVWLAGAARAGAAEGPGTVAAAGQTDAASSFVGTAACVPCHETEARLWRGSHHDLAMQPAEAGTVLGNFADATFRKDGVTTTFFRRDGRYMVRTDGPDGKLQEYRVAWVFGVDPLQQLLLELPGGRLQALSIAWDARPKAAGGQRWFHLYPDEKVDHRDVLHWTGPAQNWNHMCADCHSTRVRKGYRAAEDRFETTWSDVDVGCEACHGPGAGHLRWAAARPSSGPETPADPLRGFAFRLGGEGPGAWAFAPGAAIAHREKPLASRREVESCAPCHSRRAQIWQEDAPGDPLEQRYRLSLLEPRLYHDDGQIQDEVYEYGSFAQSRMYAAGVTCSDCHDPHSGALRAAGNALCARCHLPAQFDTPAHHFHPVGSAGARCVSCHMPEHLYMVVDARHDHGFRVPRPDLAEKLGTPEPCTGCHAGKNAAWAAAVVAKKFPSGRSGTWHYAEALHADRTDRVDATSQLLRAARDETIPEIVRATVVSQLAAHPGVDSQAVIRGALKSPSPLLRRAGAEAAMGIEPEARASMLSPLLADPVRSVRLEAAAGLVDASPPGAAARVAGMDRAIEELRKVQAGNADRADALVNLGMLEARVGRPDAARAALQTAIRRQPSYAPAYLGLADLERAAGQDAAGEAILRRGLEETPQVAELHHALGLCLVRQRRGRDALPALAKAAELRPDVWRFAYVQGVATHDLGDAPRAIEILARAQAAHPGVPEILSALAQYEAEAGRREKAVAWARQLAQVTGDPAAARLVEQLEAKP